MVRSGSWPGRAGAGAAQTSRDFPTHIYVYAFDGWYFKRPTSLGLHECQWIATYVGSYILSRYWMTSVGILIGR